MDDVGQLKERAKTVWALGDYPAVARRFEAVADDVVAACGIAPGQRVLDVASGNGFTGQVTELMGEYLPSPLVAARPIDWGIEATVRARMAPHAADVQMARGTVMWEFASAEETIGWQEANFGALVAARAALGDGYAELRERMVGLMREWNRADDGSVRLPAAYLRAVGRRP